MESTLSSIRRQLAAQPDNPNLRRLHDRTVERLGLTVMADVMIALGFIFAGRARITLESQRTGVYLYFRVAQKTEGTKAADNFKRHNLWYVGYGGSASTSDFESVGYIYKDAAGIFQFRMGKDVCFSEGSVQVKAFKYLLRALNRREMPGGVNVLRANKCGRCGRWLKVPSSIKGSKAQEECRVLNQKYGIGPICRGTMGIR